MNTETVVVPGLRDVRGSLDTPEEGTDCAVVACPPHPQFGGDRRDRRLRAVGETLVGHGVACLRIDYGPWDEGDGERTDVHNALAWAADRYDRVGLFGYSFGAATALLATADLDSGAPESPLALSALAPGSRATDTLARVDCPVQVLYGIRDDTVDWGPVADRARDLGMDVVELSADHHFVGQAEKVAATVAAFLLAELA